METNSILTDDHRNRHLVSKTVATVETTDEWKPSTQEIIGIQSQEASNASDFFDNLRDSQILTNELSSSQSTDSQIKTEDLIDVQSVDSMGESKPSKTEKKKRGRKRKIRTPEELEIHLKEKKEKNRLAAQRLRQKKCSESAKYDQEVQTLEANVRAKKQFADLIENNVNQLRTKIQVMFGQKYANKTTGNVSKQIEFVSKPIVINGNNQTSKPMSQKSMSNSQQQQQQQQKVVDNKIGGKSPNRTQANDFKTINASNFLLALISK